MTWEYVSPSVYENDDCEQLAKALVSLGYQIEDLHERLEPPGPQ
jgi:hypothetical protein